MLCQSRGNFLDAFFCLSAPASIYKENDFLLSVLQKINLCSTCSERSTGCTMEAFARFFFPFMSGETLTCGSSYYTQNWTSNARAAASFDDDADAAVDYEHMKLSEPFPRSQQPRAGPPTTTAKNWSTWENIPRCTHLAFAAPENHHPSFVGVISILGLLPLPRAFGDIIQIPECISSKINPNTDDRRQQHTRREKERESFALWLWMAT